MIKIVFVVPYLSLVEEVEMAFQRLNRSDVDYNILHVQKDEEEILEKLRGDVVIARGFASAYFRQNMPDGMISVEIMTTGMDIVLAVQECIEKYNVSHIAIMGTKSMIYCSHNLGQLFPGVELDYYYMEKREMIPQMLEAAKDAGAQAIIGGRTVCRYGENQNLPTIIIQTGSEAIMKAQEMAIRLVEETRKEREEKDRISKIMDYSYGGIISTDGEGIIRSINKKACGILRTSEDKAIGKSFTSFFKRPDIPELVKKKKRCLDEVCRVGNALITLNCVPIEGGGANAGAVITCNEARELQKTEAKLRREIMQRGFVAKYTFDDIVHEDSVMKQVINKAKRFSRNESNVFIGGETGVGKEMIAQSIHNESRRQKGPFVAINCAALPEQLLESELFGYVEGAFTGASKSGKMGLFEAAHGGTVFLDEIGDLSLKLQGRLLRVLQEKEIVRVGDNHVLPVDVRVISATNRNLIEEVEAGNFRSDLMYRLEVLKIGIPPLRYRKEDVIPLVWTFVNEVCVQEHKLVFEEIEVEAEELLKHYPWKGNVRQLRNIVQRICVLCDDTKVRKETVREALELEQEKGFDDIMVSVPNLESVELTEKERIVQALQDNHYNRNDTAFQLGMDRSTLWRKMKKYKIN